MTRFGRPPLGQRFPLHPLTRGPVAIVHVFGNMGLPLVAVSGLTLGGVQTTFGALSLTGIGSMTAGATRVQGAALSMSASGSASFGVIEQQFGALGMSATASMTLGALQTFATDFQLTGNGSLSFGAHLAFPSSFVLAGQSTLSLATFEDIFSPLLLSGLSSLSLTTTGTTFVGLSLSGQGSLSFHAFLDSLAALTMQGQSSLSILGVMTAVSQLVLTGSASLSMNAKQTIVVGLLLQAAGRTIFDGRVIQDLRITFSGVGSLTISPDSPTVTKGFPPRESYYVRDRQDWAIEQERMRHDQALWSIGELGIFVLMWDELDFHYGAVDRCKVCFRTGNAIQDRITAVYKQPTKNRCPDCFGTTFEGGYRARIVRPTLITDVDEKEQLDRRGSMHPADIMIETTWDFRSRNGDFFIRADGSRWRLEAPIRTTLRAGFGYAAQLTTQITYGNIRAHLEEPSTVVYTIPPLSPQQFGPELDGVHQRPVSFPDLEDIRGALIPMSTQG